LPNNADIQTMPDTADALRLKPCPVCRKMAVAQFRPFCSRRCADVDLNRWLSGVYAVPVTEDDERPEDGEAPEEKRG
jgi:uncharacterized protein